MRSLLLATALSFAGSETSWSIGGGGGGGAPAPAPPPPVTILDPPLLFFPASASPAVAISTVGQYADAQNSIAGKNFRTINIAVLTFDASNRSFINAATNKLLKAAAAAGLDVGPAQQCLNAILLLFNHNGTPGDAPASYGTWASVVADAQGDGVSPEAILAGDALVYLFYLYEGLHGINAPNNPYVFVSREPTSAGSAVAFTDEPTSGLPDDIALAYASILKVSRAPAAVPFQPGWMAWASGYGAYNRTNGDPAAGTNTLTARLAGAMVGLEYHFTPATLLGFSLGGAGLNYSQAPGSGSSDAAQFTAYGTTHFGAAYVTGLLDASINRFNTTRFGGGDEITARFNAQSYGGRIEGGYRYPMWLTSGVTPYAALQLQYFHTPAYAETDLTGGGMGVNFNAMNTTDTRSELGARFDTVWNVNRIPVVLRARVAWAHDWVSNSAVTEAFQIAPGASFIVNGAALPSDSALGSLEAEFHLAPNWSLAAKFDGQFANSAQTYLGAGTLRYTW